MIFNDFNPIEDKTFRIIDNDGKVTDQKRLPDVNDETITKA
jgi:pyruvate dehydrogenase E1 component alpha subunit